MEKVLTLLCLWCALSEGLHAACLHISVDALVDFPEIFSAALLALVGMRRWPISSYQSPLVRGIFFVLCRGREEGDPKPLLPICINLQLDALETLADLLP